MHIKGFDPYDFSKKEIDGVTVYYKNLPWAPCIHVRFLFSVGAFNDPVGKEGVAHFLEHMIGNGSPLVPDKKAVKEFSRLYMLNSRNAFTSYNWTAYVCKFLPENFNKVITTMADYVCNPFLRTEDVEHERKVITQEAWGRYKNDKFLNYIKEISSNIYSGHERSRIASPLGWPETVGVITQEDIVNFHKNHYVKENLSLFLVGAVTEKEIDSLHGLFSGFPSGDKANKDEGFFDKPKLSRMEKTGEEIGDPREQLEFSLFRVIKNSNQNEDYVGGALRVLMQDVLFERLRVEKSLCYGVSVSVAVFKSFINIIVSIKTSADKLSVVEKEVWDIIEEILNDKWVDRYATLKKLSLDQVRSRERLSEDIISTSTDNLIVDGKIESLEETLNKIDSVKYDDVKRFVKIVFDRDYVFTEVIYPNNK